MSGFETQRNSTQTASSSSDSAFLLYPFIFEQPLSDRISLIWTPFPLELHYQLFHDRVFTWGLAVDSFGAVRARYSRFNWKPSLSTYARRRLGYDFALEGELFYRPEFQPENKTFSSTTGAQGGPVYQLSSNDVLGLKSYFLYENGNPTHTYLGNLPSTTKHRGLLRVPVSLWNSWRIDKEWEVAAELIDYRLGYDADFRSQQLLATLFYYF